MEFLVNIKVAWPPDGDEARKAELTMQEGVRAGELAEAGTLVRLSRIPGSWANVGIWQAPDATLLHEAIASLPLYPWLEVSVTPLANHPRDPGWPKSG
jgi:muconolactone D-isomerase